MRDRDDVSSFDHRSRPFGGRRVLGNRLVRAAATERAQGARTFPHAADDLSDLFVSRLRG